MEKKVKEAYDQIKMSEQSREKILLAIRKECEDKKMNGKKNISKLAKAAMIAVAACLCLPVVTLAALKYSGLSAKEIAEKFVGAELAEKFEKVEVVESCEDGEYRFLYLGNVTTTLDGEAFEGREEEQKEHWSAEGTYVVVAIERMDGNPVREGDGIEFMVSPFIQGLNPIAYNLLSMDGAVSWSSRSKGRLYMITRVDSLEMFADREIYLGVTKGPNYKLGYNYDEKTGRITANEAYEGVNVLFRIKLDESKADPQAQEEYLEKISAAADATMVQLLSHEGEYKSAFWGVLEEPELFSRFTTLDFASMDTAKVEEVVHEGTVVESMDLTPDENGTYKIKANDLYGIAAQEVGKKEFPGSKAFVKLCYANEEEQFVILQYCRKGSTDILHVKYVRYEMTDIKSVFAIGVSAYVTEK